MSEHSAEELMEIVVTLAVGTGLCVKLITLLLLLPPLSLLLLFMLCLLCVFACVTVRVCVCARIALLWF